MTDVRPFTREKYWLKNARVPVAAVDDAGGLTAGADGMAAADLRIEDGRIRAVLPAGGAPCCCRGVDLAGGLVRPLGEGGRLAAGGPADLLVDCGAGGRVTLRAGAPDGQGCGLGVGCVCTPPGGSASS